MVAYLRTPTCLYCGRRLDGGISSFRHLNISDDTTSVSNVQKKLALNANFTKTGELLNVVKTSLMPQTGLLNVVHTPILIYHCFVLREPTMTDVFSNKL